MKYLPILIILISFLSPLALSENSLVVVANTQDKSIKLSRQQVRNLFMGGALSYDLRAIALPPDNQTRVLFNTLIVGLTESRIQSYWAQMRFSGRKSPPPEVDNETLAVKYLKEHPGTVAYLPADMPIPNELTVILQIQ